MTKMLASFCLGIVAGVLLVALYVSMLGCGPGDVKVEGDIFEKRRCFAVVDGVVHSQPPTLGES